MSRKKPPAAPPVPEPPRRPVPRALPDGLATIGPADVPGLPPEYLDRTAFVPHIPYPGVPLRADPGLRFTLAQASRVTPAVQAVVTCREAMRQVPAVFALQGIQPDHGPAAPPLPAVLADAFARLVVELDRVLYLAGRL